MQSDGAFGPPSSWPDQDLIALSHDFSPELVLRAYTEGVFPMPLVDADFPDGVMSWWSPVERGIMPFDAVRISRSLRKSARKYRVSFDRCFDEVVARCADPSRDGGWIDATIAATYGELHRRGFAHSVEVWTADGQLAGGLYGIAIGGLFAGESMFHDPDIGRDASKVALVALLGVLDDGHDRLLDVQWVTPHLASLGAQPVQRDDYLQLLGAALQLPAVIWLC